MPQPTVILVSPEALLYQALIEHIQAEVPEIKYIEQDLGQLENYDLRPAVSWPCLLIDMDGAKFSDAGNDNHQLADCLLSFRLGLVKYTNDNSLTPTNIRAKALSYFELENKLFKALHAWAPQGFGALLRRETATERRDDDIRVRVSKYIFSYTDTTAAPVRTTIPRPNPTLG